MTQEALTHLKVITEAFGPEAGIELDQKAWSKLHTAINAALAQSEQEPVGYVAENGVVDWNVCAPPILTDLYTAPPQRTEQSAKHVEPVAWPAGLIERIKGAERRIQDGHAPRRIPADPTDVDLVLAEVRYLLEGKQPPFWVNTSPPPQRTWVGLTDEEITDIWAESSPYYHEDDFARAVEAKLKEKNT